ncbi:helix-turn-helix domain-containing protein [Phyllobacterium leguminum]|uniref:helix-turn-helix domain-containing protein n=1 Tax=Phyllobacterium leguminum TaxID=314237 RepID=UPI001FE03E7B|nr:helix-turn-helix domain-containing protein [Phyllobacterium leguminum]
MAKKPAASAVMHILCAHLGEHNAVVISQETIAKLCHLSTRSVRRAITDLEEGNWIEVRQIGATSQTNAYVVNDRVAWQGSRDGLRYSLFSAAVVVSETDQPDRDELEHQKPLRRLPRIGEGQLPAGDGLPPPSQAFLDGFEPELPAAGQED